MQIVVAKSGDQEIKNIYNGTEIGIVRVDAGIREVLEQEDNSNVKKRWDKEQLKIQLIGVMKREVLQL